MQNLIKKLLEVQKAIKPIEKDSQNPHFKSWYFDINKLLADVKPVLSRLGLIVLQPLVTVDGKPAITTMLIDSESGEKMEATINIPDLQDPQKMGAVISYFRRYALTSFLALEGEDDDGESAKPVMTQPSAAQKPTTQASGACKDCGSAMVPGKNGKPYCVACYKKWKASQEAPLPVIKVDDREEFAPPFVD